MYFFGHTGGVPPKVRIQLLAENPAAICSTVVHYDVDLLPPQGLRATMNATVTGQVADPALTLARGFGLGVLFHFSVAQDLAALIVGNSKTCLLKQQRRQTACKHTTNNQKTRSAFEPRSFDHNHGQGDLCQGLMLASFASSLASSLASVASSASTFLNYPSATPTIQNHKKTHRHPLTQ
jgi:hypothetical protein